MVKAIARPKGTIVDAAKGCGQFHVAQPPAGIEGSVADGFQFGGQRHPRQELHLGKLLLGQGGERGFAQVEFGEFGEGLQGGEVIAAGCAAQLQADAVGRLDAQCLDEAGKCG